MALFFDPRLIPFDVLFFNGGMLVSKHAFRHFTGQPGGIHRIDLRIKDRRVEMPDQNGQRSQNRFVIMNNKGDVQYSLGQEPYEKVVKPEDETGKDHNHIAPDERPILRLFDVAEPFKLRFFLGEAQVVQRTLKELEKVLRLGNHVREKTASSARKQEIGVPNGGEDEDNSGDTMDNTPQFESSRPSKKDAGENGITGTQGKS